MGLTVAGAYVGQAYFCYTQCLEIPTLVLMLSTDYLAIHKVCIRMNWRQDLSFYAEGRTS